MSVKDSVDHAHITLTRDAQDIQRIDVRVVYGRQPDAPDAIAFRFSLDPWIAAALTRPSDVPTGAVTMQIEVRGRRFSVPVDMHTLKAPERPSVASAPRGVSFRLARPAVPLPGKEHFQFAIDRGDAFHKAGSWLSQDGWVTDMAWILTEATVEAGGGGTEAGAKASNETVSSDPLPVSPAVVTATPTVTATIPPQPLSPGSDPVRALPRQLRAAVIAAAVALVVVGGLAGLWSSCQLPWMSAQCQGDLHLAVIDAASRAPIPGVSVVVREGGDGAERGQATTDGDGNAMLSQLVRGMRLGVSATAPGYTAGAVPPAICCGGRLVVELKRVPPPPAELRVLVVDAASRAPIPGAAVMVRENGDGAEHGQATTDGVGKAMLPQQVRGMRLGVSATAPDYMAGAVPSAICCDGQFVVELKRVPPPSAPLYVRVIDAVSRAPILGAEVAVRLGNEPGRKAIADAAGRASFPGETPSSSLTVTATAPNYMSGSAPAIDSGGGVTIALQRVPSELRFRVVDAATSAPIAGAQVSIRTLGGLDHSATTNAAGEAGFSGQPAETSVSANAVAPGYLQGALYGVTCCDGPAQVLALRRALADLHVAVVDAATGSPIPAADVTLYEGAPIRLRNKLAVDNVGRASFSQQPRGASLAVGAASPGYDSGQPQTIICCAPQPEVIRLSVLQFAAGRWLAGNVPRRGDSKPIDLAFDIGRDGSGSLTIQEPEGQCSTPLSISFRNQESNIKLANSLRCSRPYGFSTISCTAETNIFARCVASYDDDGITKVKFGFVIKRER
jgi:hypothetical protein